MYLIGVAERQCVLLEPGGDILASRTLGAWRHGPENRVVLRVPPCQACYGSGASGGCNGSTLVLDAWTKAPVFISNLSVVR